MSVITFKTGTLEYLAAENIGAPHCFTTRLGGVSTGYLSGLNIAHHRGDDPENVAKNIQILSDALGFSTDSLVLAHQTHSDIVRCVNRSDALGLDHHQYPECDALITADPGTALMVYTADCTPILLHDPVTGAVGAVHAGWRGTASGIAAKTVAAMVSHFGCHSENIQAAIGPNIGPCCFETDADVPTAMVNALGSDANAYISQQGNKYYVNLKELNALHVRRAGVNSIAISSACTACAPHRYWSHRVTGGQRGSQGAIIICKETSL